MARPRGEREYARDKRWGEQGARESKEEEEA
jgi:hypothetical protein